MLHTIMALRDRAVAELDALGPRPRLPRDRIFQPIHPGEWAWEAAVSKIGRDFWLAVWEAAKRDEPGCRAYVAGWLSEAPYWPDDDTDEPPPNDESVEKFAAEITPRWALSIRHIGSAE